MSDAEFGFVYIWYDRFRKMYYIGSHWGTEDDGYICSSPWMNRAYKKRPQHFKRRIIKRFSSQTEMIKEENRYLSMIKENEIKIKYYNLRLGAWELWHNKHESRLTVSQKISNSRKGKYTGPRTEEHCQAISEAKLKKNAEKREKLGYVLSPDHVEKVQRAHLGKKHTEEWKQQNAQRTKEQWASGQRKSSGPLSEEHKKKQSEALRGRKLSTTQVEQIRQRTSKEWIVVSPDGIEHTVKNLKQFCAEHGLANTNITKKCGSKGWKAVKT